ncbi:hypothetical protein M3J09_008212 [Ascochyta lentis]
MHEHLALSAGTITLARSVRALPVTNLFYPSPFSNAVPTRHPTKSHCN